jgi:hypothetical protein
MPHLVAGEFHESWTLSDSFDGDAARPLERANEILFVRRRARRA